MSKDEVTKSTKGTRELTDEEVTARFVQAVLDAKERLRSKRLPVQEWDDERKEPYLLYPDGRRKYYHK